MSRQFKLDNGLLIHVVTDEDDPLLTREFYSKLYNNVFISEENNLKAGLVGMNDADDVKNQVDRWLIGNSDFMFFLYKGSEIMGTTQAFGSNIFDDNTLSLGYIMSPQAQGKGYGTLMLKFVSEYPTEQKITVVLGFRDGNIASERIAAKSNYSYLMRTYVPDANGLTRPMTFYKYQGKPIMNESYNVIPNSKILTTNQWIDKSNHILSRVNPKMLNLEEYVYLTTSTNKPISLNETYYLFTTPHYTLKDELKKEKIKTKYFALTDSSSKKLFNPSSKGDIVMNEFCNLLESKLTIVGINNDRSHMLLASDIGDVGVEISGDILIVNDFLIYKK